MDRTPSLTIDRGTIGVSTQHTVEARVEDGGIKIIQRFDGERFRSIELTREEWTSIDHLVKQAL